MQRTTFVRAAFVAASIPGSVLMPHPARAAAAGAGDATLHIIVPFPPGGAADSFAHLVGERYAAMNAVALSIDTSPRASGVLGTYAAARAPADGSTLLIATLGHAVNPYIHAKLGCAFHNRASRATIRRRARSSECLRGCLCAHHRDDCAHGTPVSARIVCAASGALDRSRRPRRR